MTSSSGAAVRRGSGGARLGGSSAPPAAERGVRPFEESIFLAIYIEFVDLIIPIATIEQCSAIGGLQYLQRRPALLGDMWWYDEFLCRAEGSMNSGDIPSMIAYWERRGLRAYTGQGEGRVWGDFCVAVGSRGPFGLPCDWLTFDESRSWAWLTGRPEGERIGPPRAFGHGT
jgi:hypothetical protein